MPRGKAALVTGGSRGVGFIAAEALASRGFNLTLMARDPGRLGEAVERLSRLYGVEARAYPGDLRVEGSVEGAVRASLEWWGGLDAVVMSYGNPSCEPCTLGEASWRDWLEAASLYIASTAEALRAVARLNTRSARFIVFTSFTTRESHDYLVVADTVRAGLPVMIRAAARLYSPKVVPILVVLGSIDTPGARATISRLALRLGRDPGELWASEVEGRSPLRRVARPGELRELVGFLAEAPEYMAGSVVYFDGASGVFIP
ncbi:SDR family oxidoreductase [Stetteria hydrogenophila]